MAFVKHVLKFSTIVDFLEADKMKLISIGENAVKSNQMKKF